eukprot:2298280-Pyramimonas_sp.AAC.1
MTRTASSSAPSTAHNDTVLLRVRGVTSNATSCRTTSIATQSSSTTPASTVVSSDTTLTDTS